MGSREPVCEERRHVTPVSSNNTWPHQYSPSPQHEVTLVTHSVSQSVRMGSPRVLLLVISVILAGAGLVSCSCSQEKYTAMQASFSNCSSQFTQQSGQICQLLESVVDQCSKLWLACHSKKEVAKMRDLHINHLIKSYQENEDLEDCRVVKEYRMSGRAGDEAEDEILCDVDTTSAVLKKLGDCSHAISTKVYTDIVDLTNVKTIKTKLCKALSAIGTNCVKDLKQCFATEDLLQMKKSHLEEMQNFPLRISQGKVSADALDNCKILDTTQQTEDQLSHVTEATENQSDKEATTIVQSKGKTSTTTTTTTTTTNTTTKVKGSRSAEFEPQSEDSEDSDHTKDSEDDDDDDDEESESSTRPEAERLPSRYSSSSSRPVISVLVIFL